MKKALFLTFAFITCFNIGSKSFADGMTEKLQPIDVYESEENAKRAYDILIKRFNIDTSFKFKQPALNYLISGGSQVNFGNYILVTKDKILEINYENEGGADPITDPLIVIGDHCSILTDEDYLTVMKCEMYQNLYKYFEFKNFVQQGTQSIMVKIFSSDSSNINDADTSFNRTSIYSPVH